MVTTEIKAHLSKILRNPGDFANQADRILDNAAKIILRNYKEEIPVDKGTARSDVKIYNNGKLNKLVTTLTSEHGFRYPVALQEGTGRWKGSPIDYGHASPGRIRSGTTNPGTGGIRPDKFADRARKNSKQEVNLYITTQISKILKD